MTTTISSPASAAGPATSGSPAAGSTGRGTGRPSTWLVSLLAALATWVTLLSWTPFAERASAYMVPLLVACLLVAGTGIALRAARLPAPLVVALQLVLLLLWFQQGFAGDAAIGGLLPTPASVGAMTDVLRESVFVSQSFRAPIPAEAALGFYPLVIVAGSLTALLVDLLAVGLRRAPLAGLPLLAAYTAAVSILDGGVPAVKFAGAALCFLFLIAAAEEQRLARWGASLTTGTLGPDTPDRPAPGQAVWSSARKIGLTTTALAVAAPLFLPSISATLFDGGPGRGNGNGDAVSISNPMVDLKRDLTRGADLDVVAMRTSDPDPSYLRLSVLDAFDGEAWRPSARDIPVEQRADGALPKPPGLLTDVRSRTYSASLQISDSFDSRWLPSPYPVAALDAPGDWRYDRGTMDFVSATEDQDSAGLRYDLRSLTLSPSATQLSEAAVAPSSVSTPNTAVPRGLSPFVRRLALSVTDPEKSKFEQAVDLQRFFRQDGGFRYSLERSAGNGTDSLVQFLTTGEGGRVGYCEQFAAAMALMGRTLNIPSRVAVGFLKPERAAPNTYVYSTHDLHAWPEMYFGGIGWVRFEPTPQSRADDVPAYTTQQIAAPVAPTASSAPSSAAAADRLDKIAEAQAAAEKEGDGGGVRTATVAAWAGGALAVALLLLAPRLLRELVRRRRWAGASTPGGRVEAAWDEIRDTAADLAISWDDRVTLRTSAARLQSSFGHPDHPDDALGRGSQRGAVANPEAAAALHRLVGLLERSRYARHLPDEEAGAQQVRADADLCREAMRAGAGRRRRVRATWLPVSLLASVGTRRALGRRGSLLGEQDVDRAVRSGA
ncbi:MAG TPA: DUF3488 and transglutaminase-like domain-containing protein [Nocardioidaceae bacterium]|nr:DUF3488 and transglutaminase-like domain-containing protein [Nocardioidaceae bacterium]